MFKRRKKEKRGSCGPAIHKEYTDHTDYYECFGSHFCGSPFIILNYSFKTKRNCT